VTPSQDQFATKFSAEFSCRSLNVQEKKCVRSCIKFYSAALAKKLVAMVAFRPMESSKSNFNGECLHFAMTSAKKIQYCGSKPGAF
jgi:hypothetical protein